MLVIRLMRTGKIHAPHYRIVVQERRSKLNGDAIDTIGHYHPASSDKLLVVDKEKAKDWLKKGAQPSDTVTNLLVKEGVLDKSKKIQNFFTPKKKEDAKDQATEKAAVKETKEEATQEGEESAEKNTEESQEQPAEEVATEESAEQPATETTPEEAPAEAASEEKSPETAESAETAPETDSVA